MLLHFSFHGAFGRVYKHLGHMLVLAGEITEAQLNTALDAQRKDHHGKEISEILIEMGFITQRRIYAQLEKHFGCKFIDLTSASIPKALAEILPRSLAKRHSMVPIDATADTIYIAMEDPLDFVAIEEAQMATKREVIPLLAAGDAIARVLTDLYDSEPVEKALQALKGSKNAIFSTPSSSILALNAMEADNESAAPIIRLVNGFLEYAVNQNSSDIHLEPRETAMYVRMRIDGLLRQTFVVPRAIQSAVIARIKVMGNMDIAEHRVPLDGRSDIRIGEKNVDLRISTLPTVYGEKVVIRLLNQSSVLLSAEGIGLSGHNLEKFNRLLQNSNGVILIVGPTGSGKSSTMYTMIDRLNTEQVNLVTLEDPVEYNFDGVNQVQINEKTGLTFANGLRSILRQDPDIIAVGEIRDGETAEIAMRAAITGHLVLSTLHTNDAPSTIDRLLDMGVERYFISSALKGIISQRLVRCICPNCREEYYATPEEQQMLHLPHMTNRRFYRGKGCPLCFGTGYRGRTAVFEILTINRAIRQAISEAMPQRVLLERIEESDFVPMISDCVRLVENGTTTVEEAYRTISATYQEVAYS